MSEIEITVTGAQAELASSPLLTGGMVGLPVRFTFDESWEGLRRTAVFRAGGRTVACPEIEESTTIPWEVMCSGCTLTVGVYGCNDDGTLAIPTVWVPVGTVQPGADPEADPGAAPTLPVWQLALDTAAQAVEIAQQVRSDADAGVFNGETGEPGTDGHTPVRGVDYWTDADKDEIKSYVDEAILGGAW